MSCSNRSIDNLIPDSKGVIPVVLKKDGNTQDIIDTIIKEDERAFKFTKDLSSTLKGASLRETLNKVWVFVKCNIQYQIDPFNSQYIKQPHAVWRDKFADCKSYSLFIASVLRNLGIPYAYRFVSYNSDPTVTHVYIVVPKGTCEQYYTIDACMNAFNQEKKFTFKNDYKMTKIYVVGNASTGRIPGKLQLNKPLDQMSEGELELHIARQRLELEKNINESKRGVGNIKAEKYQDMIDIFDHAIGLLESNASPEAKEEGIYGIMIDAHEGRYNVAGQLAGIGDPGTRNMQRMQHLQRLAATRPGRCSCHKNSINGIEGVAIGKAGKTKLGKLLKKAATGVKKVAKAHLKVIKAITKKSFQLTAGLGIKLVLETMLPKAAPFFLYLFIDENKIIQRDSGYGANKKSATKLIRVGDALPAKVKAKRKKQEKIADFIVNIIGMKRPHFMGLLRNGIIKHMKKSPEAVLQDTIYSKISGIGFLPIVAAAVPMLMKLIKKLMEMFKKKAPAEAEGLSNDDAPNEDDFKGMNSDLKSSLVKHVKQGKEPSEGDDQNSGGGNDNSGGGGSSGGSSEGGGSDDSSGGGSEGNSGGGMGLGGKGAPKC